MIVRVWLATGVLLVAVAWVLTVIWPPAAHQTSVVSMAGAYRSAGMLPPAGELTMSRAVAHDVFEIPATDPQHALEEAAAHGGEAAAGSGDDNRGAMPMPTAPEPKPAGEAAHGAGTAPAEGMAMTGMPATAADAGHGAMSADKMAGEAMAPPGEAMADMGHEAPGAEAAPEKMAPNMAMAPKDTPMQGTAAKDMPMKEMPGMGDGHAEEAEEMGGHGGGGPAFGMTILAQGRAGAMAAMHVNRSVEIKMAEWGYTPASLMAAPGEVLRLVVRNAGNMPHEFMIMQQGGMQAVNYRLERADWTLTEHEALFEKPVVMPGDSFEMIVRIEKPGSWMFMCMFPYHMQMGMMGMIMTAGAPVGGMNMGGMNMESGGSMGGMKMESGGSMGGMKMESGGTMPDQGGQPEMKGMDGGMDEDAPAKMNMDGDHE